MPRSPRGLRSPRCRSSRPCCRTPRPRSLAARVLLLRHASHANRSKKMSWEKKKGNIYSSKKSVLEGLGPVWFGC
jgi:hypothetical protein